MMLTSSIYLSLQVENIINRMLRMNNVYFWSMVGLVLIAAEILVGNFVLLLFGLVALTLALIQMVFGDLTLTQNAFLFAFLGLVGTYILKKKNFFQKNGLNYKTESDFYLDKTIQKKSSGYVKYQGSEWLAVNDSESDLVIGQKVKVKSKEGNKLIIEKMEN